MATWSASYLSIDLDEPLPARPLVFDAARLRKAGEELVVAVSNSSERELYRCTVTLAMKAARVAGYLEDSVNTAWDADAAANLLLIERLRADVATRLAKLGAAGGLESAARQRAERAIGALDAVIGPLIDSVGRRPGHSSPCCLRRVGHRRRFASSTPSEVVFAAEVLLGRRTICVWGGLLQALAP